MTAEPSRPPSPGSVSDPQQRPADPAGTRPRHDPESLLPAITTPVPEVRERPAPDRATDPVAGAPPAPVRHSRFAPRFSFLLGTLVAFAAAAVVALVAVAGDEGTPSSARAGDGWSPWRPAQQGVAGAQEIAAYVGARYKNTKGVQYVRVSARGLELGGAPLSVVLREAAESGGEIREVGRDAVIFELCGLGPSCAIDSGRPSTQRGLLLSREAVELALYAFKYLDIEQVYVQLPPLPGEQPMRMLVFERPDFASELSRPLATTLNPELPSIRTVDELPDAGFVFQLMTRHRFLFQLRSGGLDDGVVLVLDPYDPDEERRRQRLLQFERAEAVREAVAGAAPPASP